MNGSRFPLIEIHIARQVKIAFTALLGCSAVYGIWKWLTFSSEGAISQWKGKKGRTNNSRIPGLVNVGNTCFMNVLLQCLASCESFLEWLSQFAEECKSDQEHKYMCEILLKILKILSVEADNDQRYFDPSGLLEDLAGRGWQISSEEQDAHEFFHVLMTTLLEERHHMLSIKPQLLVLSQVQELLKNPAYRKRTPFTDNNDFGKKKLKNHSFRGTLGCVLRCQSCGYQNPIRYDGFDSLSLPIPSDFLCATEQNLYFCLRSFTAPEILTGIECKNCSFSKAADKVSGRKKNPDGGDCVNEHSSTATDRKQNAEINLKYENSCNNNTPRVPTKPAVTKPSPESLRDNCSGRRNELKFRVVKPKASFVNEVSPVKRSFVRWFGIGKLPDCLCVHFQRLVWEGGTLVKKMRFVSFPEILDMKPYTDVARQARKRSKETPANSRSVTRPEQMLQVIKNNRSVKYGIVNKSEDGSVPSGNSEHKDAAGSERKSGHASYRLVSVIVHLGDWNFTGHFLAYRRLTGVKDGIPYTRWLYTSDTVVRKASREEVFSCLAYILFYERIRN